VNSGHPLEMMSFHCNGALCHMGDLMEVSSSDLSSSLNPGIINPTKKKLVYINVVG